MGEDRLRRVGLGRSGPAVPLDHQRLAYLSGIGADPGIQSVLGIHVFGRHGLQSRLSQPAGVPRRRSCSLSPQAGRGRGEGQGEALSEGLFPATRTRGGPSPGAQERADLSPQAGRGEDFDIAGYEHAVRLWTVVLEISVLMAQFPSPRNRPAVLRISHARPRLRQYRRPPDVVRHPL